MFTKRIIKSFIFTLKSEQQKKDNNVYTFYTDPSFKKYQIKEFLENFFKIRIEKIGVSIRKPVLKDTRRKIYTKLKKKVFVKLRPGYKISDTFNNQFHEENLLIGGPGIKA